MKKLVYDPRILCRGFYYGTDVDLYSDNKYFIGTDIVVCEYD